MKQTISIIAALFLFTFAGIAQDDAKANEVLKKASEKMEGYKTLKIKFGVTITTPDEDPISQKGVIKIKGDKYHLDITDQEVFCDGVNITTYLKEDNECYKSKVEDQEEDMMSPEELLTIWEKGYKKKYDGEQEYAGEQCHVIFLYPTNPKESKFHTVKLLINKNSNEVVYVYLKGKDGTNMKYKLVEMERDVEMPDQIFEFDPAQHPGVECFDE
ncbi:outer membrane lipoprotein carrier protein LolA [Paracrocinitomix mangrovi]|uniref:LolA family protein n=1 Tax=Paracrocinitomix mangrovi TaxID=2862509 RepID=UPI001C8D3FB3|nr:outer membrane lipoprotein carrier protein LolA [Paracrocinitomix mangrovi]UKN02539.1 outer membrane lipoprotein carrier protein LolA [Paracrocinitomix mangrovi]